MSVMNLIEGTHADGPVEDRCTVLIIGAGAGGPAAALELAGAGVDTVIVEEGGWYAPEFYRDLKPMSVFKHLYRDYGMTAAIGRHVLKDPTIPFPIGKCVGGTTVINSGTCFRLPESVQAQWNEEFGLEIDGGELEEIYHTVEEILHVESVPDEVLGRNAELFKSGAEKLGWHGAPLRRNAGGCRGSGRCVFGCPTNAKRGTNISYVPLALQAGARLYSDLRVERLLRKGDRIVGVEGHVRDRDRNTSTYPARIMADVVIVAAGAVGTPLLLQRNGIAGENKHLGRNLRLHPGIRVCARFDERIDGWKGVPQGYFVDEFWQQQGIMFEGIFVPPPVAIPILPGTGETMRGHFEHYPHLASFGAMVKDTSSGTVRPRGKRGSLITYSLNDLDREHLVDAVKKASEVYFAAGAKEVYPAIYGHGILKNMDDVRKIDPGAIKGQHLEPMAFHPMGTVRMAADPAQGVLDPNGKVYGTDNLYVADASVFPTCLGVNPMQPIMTFAHRIARGIIEGMG